MKKSEWFQPAFKECDRADSQILHFGDRVLIG